MTAIPHSVPASDDTLAAWREAAEAGALPTPATDRWQPLRAGVVNLWEFAVDEYWFADGRAQLIGQNQSGKSTLMALTTLILLAGDLDRQFVDTFGDSQKSFRYYVEPTGDPKDRRETDSSTNQGWAWVEYGRLDATGQPVYYTTLLYSRAKRGANDFTKRWAVCASSMARVRDGISLADGDAVVSAADVDAAVPDFRIADSGTEYRAWQARELFGFTDHQRMDVVVRMLKVLRTPHLGQKLDPDFLTSRMREALPAIERDEIDELAEGWDQLDRLATDKDNAETALAGVQAFIRAGWAPWADATIRRHADALTAATTRLDDVTRVDRRASEALTAAEDSATETQDEHAAAVGNLEEANIRFEEHLRSAAYQNAVSATERINSLTATVRQSERNASRDADIERAAEGVRTKAFTRAQQTKQERDTAAAAVSDHAASTMQALTGTGLPEDARAWINDADTARLGAAVRHQKQRIGEVRVLLRAAEHADQAVRVADELLSAAQTERDSRDRALDAASGELESQLQVLSDALETWSVTLAPAAAPQAGVRAQWVAAVTETAANDRPGAVLGGLIQSQWLSPAVAPLREDATRSSQRADQLEADAQAQERLADTEEAQKEPTVAPPSGWTRRARPTGTADGAPLWRVLDPAPDLAQPVLDRVEAALHAAGLLDAWVTADGAWVGRRDSDDLVLTPYRGQSDPPDGAAHDATGAATLTRVLHVAADAGPLADTVAAVLTQITWLPDTAPDETIPATAAFVVAADGRWRTPLAEGRAAPAQHGAELIGTAARTAARRRKVAALRAQAQAWRAEAAELRAVAGRLRDEIAALTRAAAEAPTDRDVVRAALARAAAETEAARAERHWDDADKRHRNARIERDNKHAALMNAASTQRLPHTRAGLDQTDAHLESFQQAVTAYGTALTEAAAAEKVHAAAAQTFADADQALEAATRAAAESSAQAERDVLRLEAAKEALSPEHNDALAREGELERLRTDLDRKVKDLASTLADLRAAVTKAQEHLTQSKEKRTAAEDERDAMVAAWWHLVDTGLPALRALTEPDTRATRSALEMARSARDLVRPRGWSTDPDLGPKDRAVADAWTALVTRHLPTLRAILEASGGRTVTTATREETGTIEQVLVRVDATNDGSDPVTAVDRLTRQIADLTSRHDEKMNTVLVELLSSTFVEHLRDRLATVIGLLDRVNKVLAAHPTGATRTLLRLRRVPADYQKDGFAVLEALSGRVLGDAAVQEQVRSFLKQQILEAQDRGRDSAVDWKSHLAELLDYRSWFAVVTEYKVADGDDRWHPLTRQVHGQDSGGGKVVTLLQPLLATLVAVYDESPQAPRPLWLDEAFTGVDATNRATMLDLVVSFDLDFLLAGPDSVATTSRVPSAAIWHVNRAPAPLPGVDLSLTLWAGNTRYPLAVPALTNRAAVTRQQRSGDAPGADTLFDVAPDRLRTHDGTGEGTGDGMGDGTGDPDSERELAPSDDDDLQARSA